MPVLFCKINYTFGNSIISWINISFSYMIKVLLRRLVALFFGLFLVFSCSNDDSPPEPINNEYELDGTLFEIRTNMFWDSEANDSGVDQIRLLEPIPDSALYDLIMISPVPGPSALEGTYVYSKTGDIGTYDLRFAHATDGVDDLLWYTNGDQGEKLQIEVMGKENGQNIYRILLSDFVLNYGYWDYLAGKWVSLGKKTFRLSYEGPIE